MTINKYWRRNAVKVRKTVDIDNPDVASSQQMVATETVDRANLDLAFSRSIA
jgi:hypothetical protein